MLAWNINIKTMEKLIMCARRILFIDLFHFVSRVDLFMASNYYGAEVAKQQSGKVFCEMV